MVGNGQRAGALLPGWPGAQPLSGLGSLAGALYFAAPGNSEKKAIHVTAVKVQYFVNTLVIIWSESTTASIIYSDESSPIKWMRTLPRRAPSSQLMP